MAENRFTFGDKVHSTVDGQHGVIASGPWSTERGMPHYCVTFPDVSYPRLIAAHYLELEPIEKWDTVDVPLGIIRVVFKDDNSQYDEYCLVTKLQVKVR